MSLHKDNCKNGFLKIFFIYMDFLGKHSALLHIAIQGPRLTEAQLF